MRHEKTLSRASEQTPAPFDFTGEWTNELSSTMELIQVQSVLIGVYTSIVSGTGRGAVGQLSGYAHGDLISFTVKWDTMAITAWVGRHHVEEGESVIETLWQMTSMGDDGQNGFWHSVYAGADRFTRPTERLGARQPHEREAGGLAEVPAPS